MRTSHGGQVKLVALRVWRRGLRGLRNRPRDETTTEMAEASAINNEDGTGPPLP
eukprot:SAG11_NODE_3062_length_2717_cov_3.550420_3_plen_54_part_00